MERGIARQGLKDIVLMEGGVRVRRVVDIPYYSNYSYKHNQELP
jgi:hypothetical protein